MSDERETRQQAEDDAAKAAQDRAASEAERSEAKPSRKAAGTVDEGQEIFDALDRVVALAFTPRFRMNTAITNLAMAWQQQGHAAREHQARIDARADRRGLETSSDQYVNSEAGLHGYEPELQQRQIENQEAEDGERTRRQPRNSRVSRKGK